MDLFLECATFVVGLAFGSFLNVCISRIPRDQSIVSPASFCPYCRTAILWRDNVPLLSWVMLRGRCRACEQGISFRYPAVELLTAALFVACYASFGLAWPTLKFCIFCFLIVGLIFMDAETGLLPHEFTYPGIVLGVALAWLVLIRGSGTGSLLDAIGWHGLADGPTVSLLDSVISALLGAGFFYLVWALYYLARKRHGMGFGDIALMAMIGAFLGLKSTILVIFLAPILATLFAVTMLATNPSVIAGDPASTQPHAHVSAKSLLSREIPFGVFLGISSVVALFFGEQIWGWYLGLYR